MLCLEFEKKFQAIPSAAIFDSMLEYTRDFGLCMHHF